MITIEIERNIDLTAVLDGILTDSQMDLLTSSGNAEHTYIIESTVDRYNEIDGEPLTEGELIHITKNLFILLEDVTDEQAVDIWETIRTKELAWFNDEFRAEVWDQYKSWMDAQESEKQAMSEDRY